MNIEEFKYELPEELIAQFPASNRGESKLLIYNNTQKTIEDSVFYNIDNSFNEGDLLVFNNTKVIPARLHGKIDNKNGELLVLKIIDNHIFETMGKPTKKMNIGERFILESGEEIEFTDVINDSQIGATRRCYYSGNIYDLLDNVGHMPLPPYITREDEGADKLRYQPVFANIEGAVAAPTASLHFTDEILEKLKAKKVDFAFVTLHVGVGTFRPVQVENLEEHKMHLEEFIVEEETAKKLNNAKQNNQRIIACGTTVLRTLETIYNNGKYESGKGGTDIFIYPPRKVNSVDGLITNFHLPASTLLMMIASLLGDETRENSNWYKVYSHAIKNRYRFFSYGDAMLLLK